MMKQAQEELSRTADHNIENVDEDGPCINMVIYMRSIDRYSNILTDGVLIFGISNRSHFKYVSATPVLQ